MANEGSYEGNNVGADEGADRGATDVDGSGEDHPTSNSILESFSNLSLQPPS